jgi:hypothetical protein
MGGISNRIGNDGCFRGFIRAILGMGSAAAPVHQRFDSSFFNRRLLQVKGISRRTHHLVGLRDITRLFSQMQQSHLVYKDSFVAV